MNLSEAMALVRDAYQEEQKGIVNGSKGQQYRRALEDSPVTMATALHWWAADLMKA